MVLETTDMKKIISIGLLFVILLILLTSISAWFFIPSFKSRLIEEYYAWKSPQIPRSEFRLNPNKVTYSADGSSSYVSNSRFIKVNGMTTTVLLPDGKTEIRYLGKVTSVSKATWEEIIGATNSASINVGGQAVDVKNRRIAISYKEETKILQIPEDSIIEQINHSYDRKGNLIKFNKTQDSFSNIREGDYVQYSQSDSLKRLTILIYEQ